MDESIPNTSGAGATEEASPSDTSGAGGAGTGGQDSSIPNTSGAGGDEGPGAGEFPTTTGAEGTLPTSGE